MHTAVSFLESTIDALEKVKEIRPQTVLVTGRELDDLFRVFPHLDLFDRVVAENGALLYRPANREEKLLAEAPPPEFARELIRRGATRVSIGRVIVATWEPHETTAIEVIRDMGLELQVIFNKGAVMVLPSGVNKATGLNAALQELGLSPHNVVGIGDAENDHAFMGICECSVAVANALPMLKERVDWVTAMRSWQWRRGTDRPSDCLRPQRIRGSIAPSYSTRKACRWKRSIRIALRQEHSDRRQFRMPGNRLSPQVSWSVWTNRSISS